MKEADATDHRERESLDPIQESYLKQLVPTRDEINGWLLGGPSATNARKYDAEMGWIHTDGRVNVGIDGSTCDYTYEPNGARRMTRYGETPCRISTFGDSFTHGDQVSDGETWQERLAAHLLEPIRNFGVGGYSVYQSYLRMKREDAPTPAENIVFNIYNDDPFRNLSPWYWSIRNWSIRDGSMKGRFVSNPPAPHVRANPATGEFIEYPMPCPTPDSLFDLLDPAWIKSRVTADDFYFRIATARESIKAGFPERNYDDIRSLSKDFGINRDIDNPGILGEVINEVLTGSALYATMRIIEKVEDFAAEKGKKMLYVLSYGESEVARVLEGRPRFDQRLVDFFNDKKLPFVDDLEAHREDFLGFSTTPADYLRRYYGGHYTPAGNLFQAMVLKPRLVEMLDPKPPAYRNGDPA